MEKVSSASPAAPEAAKPGLVDCGECFAGCPDGHCRKYSKPKAAKPEPQAQAGEPELHCASDWGGRETGPWLITLDDYREAIAKKDAALKACVEFMRRHAEHDQKCGVLDLDENDRHCACDCGFDAAITQAEEAMK